MGGGDGFTQPLQYRDMIADTNSHQGLCPEGWRVLTRNDFNIVIKSGEYINGNNMVVSDGVKGVRASSFGGTIPF